jgi:hypothetical protein
MNLHPQIATALIAQREHGLLRRAERHRLLSRRERPVRKAPSPGTSSS